MFKHKRIAIPFLVICLCLYTTLAFAGASKFLNSSIAASEPEKVKSIDFSVSATKYQQSASLPATPVSLVAVHTVDPEEFLSEAPIVAEVVTTPNPRTSITFTDNDVDWSSVAYDSDLYWMAKVIMGEAEGEPYEGKVAVGNVVLNRVNHSGYDNTVKGVIFAKNQFDVVPTGRINLEPNQESINAAYDVLFNGTKAEGMNPNILYFNTFGTWWDGISLELHIGHHYFGQQNY